MVVVGLVVGVVVFVLVIVVKGKLQLLVVQPKKFYILSLLLSLFVQLNFTYKQD